MAEQKIRGTWLGGEIHLSASTIKHILTTDLVSNFEEEKAGRPLLSSSDYIKDLIGRIERLRT